MRIGVYGGTFDPVHIAHLAVAEQCREQARLDQVLFVVAARPPHKLTAQHSSFQHRAEMVELAIAGNPAFVVNQMERDRPGPSFTSDTLRQLRHEHAGDELFLVVGSDSVADLPQWHEPEEVARLAQLLVVARPGWPLPSSPPPPFRWQVIDMPLMAISSSDLRRRVEEGRTIRYLVPRAVECYIESHGLYRSGAT